MTLSNPISMYGLHMATIRDRITKQMYPMRIIMEAQPDFTQEQVALRGGKSAFPWATAPGDAEASMSLTVAQFDFNILRYLQGYGASTASESTSGDASGNVTTPVNEVGTSLVNATTGVASLQVKSGENPIFGDYIIEVTGADSVDVYLNNNLDGLEFQSDDLKITSSALTVPGSSATVEIPGANLEIVGGSGSISMTTGDKASFSVRPQNTYNYTLKGGADDEVKPAFELFIFNEKLEGNLYRALHLPKVIANGVSPSMQAKGWAQLESELIVLYDSAENYAWKQTVIGR